MSEILVMAEIGIADGKRDQALAELETLSEETHAKDEGCLLYALQLDPRDESHVFMIEKWESGDAARNHVAADHCKAFAASDAFTGAPKVTVLKPASFGDATKGTL
jgi:quinol monooxygenase YgiN